MFIYLYNITQWHPTVNSTTAGGLVPPPPPSPNSHQDLQRLHCTIAIKVAALYCCTVIIMSSSSSSSSLSHQQNHISQLVINAIFHCQRKILAKLIGIHNSDCAA